MIITVLMAEFLSVLRVGGVCTFRRFSNTIKPQNNRSVSKSPLEREGEEYSLYTMQVLDTSQVSLHDESLSLSPYIQ